MRSVGILIAVFRIAHGLFNFYFRPVGIQSSARISGTEVRLVVPISERPAMIHTVPSPSIPTKAVGCSAAASTREPGIASTAVPPLSAHNVSGSSWTLNTSAPEGDQSLA